MRASVSLMVLSLAVSSWACGGGAPVEPAGPTEADRAAVEGLAAAYQQAYNASDAAGVAQLVADDYQAIQPDGTHVMGRAAFQTGLEAQFAATKAAGGTVTLTITPATSMFIDASHAYGMGTYTVTGVAEGQPTSGSYLTVLQKQADGSWTMISSLAAPYVPPATAPAMAE